MSIDEQTKKFIAHIVEQLPNIDSSTIEGWEKDLSSLKNYLFGLKDGPTKSERSDHFFSVTNTKEKEMNFIVKINRTARTIYPDWVGKILHPEFECSGPNKYDLSTDIESLPDQNGIKPGTEILDMIMARNLLERCLNIQDGLAILKKGEEVFRKVFNGKVVVLWKSLVQGQDSKKIVSIPYIMGSRHDVLWRQAEAQFGNSDLTIMFKIKE